MSRAIYFDMDGTIANLYGVENWLDYLIGGKTKPYREARPLVNMRDLGKEIKRLQKIGYKVGIVSWLSKNSTENYDAEVTKAKFRWLEKHIGAVRWDEIHIVKYGTPKSTVVENPFGILFDDELNNRKEWDKKGLAFDVDNIIEILKKMR